MPSMMMEEENYCFDVAGYVIVRGVLRGDEVEACDKALEDGGESSGFLNWPEPRRDPFVRLRDHPLVTRYLEDLSHDGYRLEREPWVLGSSESDGALAGGNEPRDPARIYHQQGEARFCQGVVAVWALGDFDAGDAGLVVVPASHKSNVEVPGQLRSGEDELGVVRQPTLKAGDLLLLAESTLHGFRPGKGNGRLVAFGYRGLKERDDAEAPDWVAELTPEAQAIVHGPGATVMSDGRRTWVDEKSRKHHPGVLRRDPESEVDETELFLWDLNGHLILEKVMDDEWVAAANAAIEAHPERIKVGGDASKGFKALSGTGVPSFVDPFDLPKPHCQAFRKMIAHPAIVHRLNWMMGTGYQWLQARGIISAKGTSGHGLHSGGSPARPANVYAFQNGRTFCEAINVAWQLRDVTEAHGGFMCMPGTHKARYTVPQRVQSFEQTMGLVEHVEMKAGDAAFFMAAAQTHGALPWKSEEERRSILLGYSAESLR